MTAWKDYQEQAATFFRSLDLVAATDERLQGVRGIHIVDVAVRNKIAGIDQLWIVECKRWKTRVSKLHVAALAEIVSDLGADRGILLSESGFQAGAIRMAQLSNVTLSSISDLEENSEQERFELRLYEFRRHLSKMMDRLHTLMMHERSSRGGKFSGRSYAVPGTDLRHITSLIGIAGGVESALSVAEGGRWPITYFEWDLTEMRPHAARNEGELLEGLNEVLVHLEDELIRQENSAREAGQGHQPQLSDASTDL